MKTKFLLFAIITLLFTACQKEDPVVTLISIPDQIEMLIGETKKMSVSHTPANLPAPVYSWSSSDPSIVSVDYSGNLNALKVGEATITVKSIELNLSASTTVKVVPIEVQSIKLTPESLDITLGDSIQLKALIQPENATDKTIVWQSNNPEIVTISDKGMVKAIGLGKTSIIAKTGFFSTICEVNVNPVEVERIQLNTQSLKIIIGSNATLTATIYPDNATNKNITWSSEDENIAKVSLDGIVTGVGVGKTKITASSGNVKATCEVIIEPIRVSNLSLNINKLTIEKGSAYTLIAKIFPENATNKTVFWESSNSQIVSVNEQGIITGLQEGSAIITAKSQDGDFTAKCEVTIENVRVKGVSLNYSSLKLAKGESKTLIATITPQDAFNKSIKWTSSDPTIVAVDQYGNIKTLNFGSAVVTVKTEDSGYTSECKIDVLPIEIMVQITALGKSIFQKTGFYITLHSKLTNPTQIPIKILSVIFIDPNRNIIEIQPGGSILSKNSYEYNTFNLYFNISSINDAFIDYLSQYKVIYQFNCQGVDYQVEQFFNAHVWHSTIN